MKNKIFDEIKKFESLQEKYKDIGSADSEPDSIFQLIIIKAIKNEPIDFSEHIDWELYNTTEDSTAVAAQLTTQAEIIYQLIRAEGDSTDHTELKKYCWRL